MNIMDEIRRKVEGYGFLESVTFHPGFIFYFTLLFYTLQSVSFLTTEKHRMSLDWGCTKYGGTIKYQSDGLGLNFVLTAIYRYLYRFWTINRADNMKPNCFS